MFHTKIFLSFLLLFLISAFYWAYYYSNFHNFKTEIAVKQEWIDTEKNLFDFYKFNKIIESEKTKENALPTETWAYFFSWFDDTSLSLLKTIPNNKNNFISISSDIKLLFSNYIQLESLLWYVKWVWSTATLTCPSWDIVKVSNWFWRCSDLNKVFLYKEWGKKKVFSWIIKRWEDDKRLISLKPIPPLKANVSYILEIEKGVKILSADDELNVETKDSIIVGFVAKNESDIVEKITEEESWTWEVLENKTETWAVIWTWTTTWTWENLEKKEENKIEEKTWTWEVLEKTEENKTETWAVIWTWNILEEETWTWENIWTWAKATSTKEEKNTSTWTISWTGSEKTWTWDTATWNSLN